MLDRPSPFWSKSDSELLNELPLTNPPVAEVLPDNVNFSSLSLDEPSTNGNNEVADSNPRGTMTICEKQMQYDQDIADYIAYLNRPVINMNDHYIEIHQYHYEPNNFIGGHIPEDIPVRPPTRRKKHKIDLKKTEIVDNKGISTITCPEYSDFLVKRGPEPPRNIRVVSGRSSDEENKKPADKLDRHRILSQHAAVAERRVDTVINKEGLVKVKRGQTFTTRSSAKPLDAQKEDPPSKGFLSFRTAKKNKSGRRKKIVVGEDGIDGPIWPAVLLTFDRSLSPVSPEDPDESQV